jgi:RsiW-degrading membrane proteinase PrsW (M82 family)
MQYIIIRNGNEYGPYDADTLRHYVNEGKILLHDQARPIGDSETNTVEYFLKQEGITVRVREKGTLKEQLNAIGKELIIPTDQFHHTAWKNDRRLLMLALIGLGPRIVTVLNPEGYWLFYVVSLYFAAIWGLFFYYLFKTDQVTTRTTLIVFFAAQAFVFLIWDWLGLPRFNPFYMLVDKGFLLSLVGYVLGVGLTEEFAKLLPLLVVYRLAKEPLQPKTLVFYGLMSGIAFGVFEGVQYQTTVNMQLDYTSSFFLNIARLTYLPFLHATWAGIAGYFFGFAKLYPLYRRSLYFLALAVPAVMHGCYDTFCGTYMGQYIAFGIMFAGVILLNSYLKQAGSYQSKLRS